VRVLRRRRKTVLALGAVVLLGAVVAFQALRNPVAEYTAGEQSEGLFDSLARDVPEDYPRVTFVDVAQESGLRFTHFPATRTNRLPEDMGSGVALGDVNGDGWCDVFAVNVAGPLGAQATQAGASRLFLGSAEGRFEDVTATSGIDLVELANGAAFVDTDSDGDLDLFVACYGTCRLFRNEGGARFRDVSREHGLERWVGFWTGVAVGDYDGNGAPDIYVCGYVKFAEEGEGVEHPPSQYGRVIPALINPSTFEPERNLFFAGQGDGTFREVAAELGVDDVRGRGLGALFCDLDGDGYQDLYVANDVSDNALYLGTAEGGFIDRTAEAQVGDYRGAMGLAAGDYDNDLDLDLFVTHWVSQENALYTQQAPPTAVAPSSPRFFDDADRLGLGHKALDKVGWATEFFDYDNDGWLDLYVINGSTIPLAEDRAHMQPMRSQLFWHARDERSFFHEVGAVSGDFFRQEYVGRGGASFDYDLDGDSDLVVMQHGGPALLLRNEGGNARAALRVRLRQPEGNTFALGARVFVSAQQRTRLEVVGAQGSYLSQRAVGEVAFGLGDAARIDELRVVWPDGTSESVGPLLPHSLVEWTRGSPPHVRSFPGRHERDAGGPPEVAEQRRFFALRDAAQTKRIAGEYGPAIDGYFEALALWPGHDDCLYYLANCLIEVGDELAALATLERMVHFEPQSNQGWMQIGRLRLPGGEAPLDDLVEARRAFTRCEELNREESRPETMLGIVALLEDGLDEAEARFTKAARQNPKSVEARWFGGRVAWLKGDRERAQQLLAEALAIALAGKPAGTSASNEGDTKSGQAMTGGKGVVLEASLERWKSLAQRPADAQAEYGSLDGAAGVPK
jgi:hypothetical protein